MTTSSPDDSQVLSIAEELAMHMDGEEWDEATELLDSLDKSTLSRVVTAKVELEDSISAVTTTVLGHAAKAFDTPVELLKRLLNAGSEVDARDDETGMTPLMFALERGASEDVTMALLGAGASVRVDVDGCTPLAAALQQGASDRVLAYMLDAGADTATVDAFGRTVLMLACGSHAASDSVVLRLLADDAADVHARDADGATALVHACMSETRKKSTQVIRRLLEAGSDATVAMKDGRTALTYATVGGECEVVQLLVQAGADARATSSDGWSALMVACRASPPNEAIIDVLLGAGADAEAVNKDGWSALMLACCQGASEAVVRKLLAHGADPATAATARAAHGVPLMRFPAGVTALDIAAAKNGGQAEPWLEQLLSPKAAAPSPLKKVRLS